MPMPRHHPTSLATLVATFVLAGLAHPAGAVAGFSEELFSDAWTGAVGMTFAADGRLFVWERSGVVYQIDRTGDRHPVVDIHDEVGDWWDHGLLGVALDPLFLDNGHIYLLYVVDHHHLTAFGTPEYDPKANEYFEATIGRITRYTALADDDFRSVDPDSRVVMLGETASSGIPIVHNSHGVGTLLFGADGTLLVSCGDGASFGGVDTGGPVAGSYAVQALAEGIITPKEDVGAFRSPASSRPRRSWPVHEQASCKPRPTSASRARRT